MKFGTQPLNQLKATKTHNLLAVLIQGWSDFSLETPSRHHSNHEKLMKSHSQSVREWAASACALASRPLPSMETFCINPNHQLAWVLLTPLQKFIFLWVQPSSQSPKIQPHSHKTRGLVSTSQKIGAPRQHGGKAGRANTSIPPTFVQLGPNRRNKKNGPYKWTLPPKK